MSQAESQSLLKLISFLTVGEMEVRAKEMPCALDEQVQMLPEILDVPLPCTYLLYKGSLARV